MIIHIRKQKHITILSLHIDKPDAKNFVPFICDINTFLLGSF